MEDETPKPKLVPFKPKTEPEPGWQNPADAIRDLVKEIDEGKIKPTKVFILFYEENAEGMLIPQRWSANVNRTESIALLFAAQFRELEDWRGRDV